MDNTKQARPERARQSLNCYCVRGLVLEAGGKRAVACRHDTKHKNNGDFIMPSDQVFLEKAEKALTFLQGIEFDQEYDDPNETKAFWEYYNDAFGVMHELLNRYKTSLNAMESLVFISDKE